MARMYSRKRGKSGSKKPLKKTVPVWVRYKPKEVEILITKLAKEGKNASQIGLYLRDVYGIPNVRTIVGKKITKLLEEKKMLTEIPDDLLSLIKRYVVLQKHLENNKQDEAAHIGLIITESKMRRLVKYYKRTNRLPKDWAYDPSRFKMYIEKSI